ncbi:peptide mating pheromone precursor Bbp2-7 [Schizophyllum commune H4-8]|uniref:Mating pheromone bbp2-7 n=2 Tax=Schizophyllum commune TaxID=5334 RepID=D8QF35_SCHCM|nr:peptide mating pheromone precursor Bbp2-7 [Schizophyllum commune H4-8]AAK58072.1 peptide mating pheromone precursor Bbp2-7 [Schizophyllum commune]KAI5887466.1 peptide mating pheromone precursor Bbp2-7 [Schizophyllum commune H4-8]
MSTGLSDGAGECIAYRTRPAQQTSPSCSSLSRRNHRARPRGRGFHRSRAYGPKDKLTNPLGSNDRPSTKPADADVRRALASGDKPCGYGGGYCVVG